MLDKQNNTCLVQCEAGLSEEAVQRGSGISPELRCLERVNRQYSGLGHGEGCVQGMVLGSSEITIWKVGPCFSLSCFSECILNEQPRRPILLSPTPQTGKSMLCFNLIATFICPELSLLSSYILTPKL